MKHCIIAKFNESAADKQAALAQALEEAVDARGFPGMADVDSSLLLFARKIAPQARFALLGECGDDLMIVVEMEKAALPNWDASRIHHQWKEQFGGLLEKKAIFDYED